MTSELADTLESDWKQSPHTPGKGRIALAMSRALKHNEAIDLEPHAGVSCSTHQPPAHKPDVPGARAGGVQRTGGVITTETSRTEPNPWASARRRPLVTT